jgi:hypothetical protein
LNRIGIKTFKTVPTKKLKEDQQPRKISEVLRFILLHKLRKLTIKTEILEKCIISALLYATQHGHSANGNALLQVAQRKMEWEILEITLQHTRNA